MGAKTAHQSQLFCTCVYVSVFSSLSHYLRQSLGPKGSLHCMTGVRMLSNIPKHGQSIKVEKLQGCKSTQFLDSTGSSCCHPTMVTGHGFSYPCFLEGEKTHLTDHRSLGFTFCILAYGVSTESMHFLKTKHRPVMTLVRCRAY